MLKPFHHCFNLPHHYNTRRHATAVSSIITIANRNMSSMPASPFPTKARIREIFAHLTAGDAPAFYAHVADDVDWTVMGTHALSGHYPNKATFMAESLTRIGGVLDGPMKLQVKSVIGGETEEWAVIELAAEARCKNGEFFFYKLFCSFFLFSFRSSYRSCLAQQYNKTVLCLKAFHLVNSPSRHGIR